MIEVTKINGKKILVNQDLFEVVEETPDTVIRSEERRVGKE